MGRGRAPELGAALRPRHHPHGGPGGPAAEDHVRVQPEPWGVAREAGTAPFVGEPTHVVRVMKA